MVSGKLALRSFLGDISYVQGSGPKAVMPYRIQGIIVCLSVYSCVKPSVHPSVKFSIHPSKGPSQKAWATGLWQEGA